MPDLLPTRFLVQTFGIDMTHHDAFNDLVLVTAAFQYSICDPALIHNDGLSTDREIHTVHTAMCQNVMHSSRR